MSETLRVLAAILLAGIVAFVAMRAFTSGSGPIDPAGMPRILYVCDDGDYEICAVNGDGAQFAQLTSNSTRDIRLSVNQRGEVAYLCARAGSSSETRFDLCITDDRGVSSRRFENLRYQINFSEYPLVLDNNTILYVCFDEDIGVEVCAMTTAGSNQRLLTSNNYVEFALSAQSNSNIAFICVDESSASFFETELCVMGPDGGSLRQITQNGLLERGVQINRRGTILTNCYEDVLKNIGLCTTNTNGRELNMLSRPAVGNAYSMNSSGQIAFQCASNLNSNICVMLSNGSGFRQLTQSPDEDTNPPISDSGLIAYHCGFSVCVINFDGTGFREITTSIQPTPVSDQKIQIR